MPLEIKTQPAIGNISRFTPHIEEVFMQPLGLEKDEVK